MNEHIKRAEHFLKDCLFDGLAHSYDTKSRSYVKPYPEVTGYVIKYLCDYCGLEDDPKVIEAVNTLIRLQHPKGGYMTFFENRHLYTFDTAQILNGLIAFYNKKPNPLLLETIKKGGEFLLFMQRKNGSFYPLYDCQKDRRVKPRKQYEIWNGPFSGINCKVNEVLHSLFVLLDDERYVNAIEASTAFYLKAKPITYTHPLGYWLEGLLQAGEIDFVKRHLHERVLPRIKSNGFIPYDSHLDYSYMSGQIQLAILFAKVGEIETAKKLRDFARVVQDNNDSGGIVQFATSEGGIDKHVHEEVNSWGTKYYCELERILDDYDEVSKSN